MKSVITALKPKYWRDLYRHFRNFNYEYDDNNDLLISHARISGVYEVETPDGLGVTRCNNLITTEGMNYLLSSGVAGGAQWGTFYIAPFVGPATAIAGWTASGFAAAATEFTSYTESGRQPFVESVPSGGSTNNTANPAVFTTNSDNSIIRGIGLLSASGKSVTTGVLLSAANYSTARSLPTSGDQISIKYTLTLANS